MSAAENLATRRSLLLQRTAVDVGESWAHAMLAAVASEGRAPAGGWPGTITQARSRIRTVVANELARARLQPAASDEVDRTARAAYARARAVWLASERAEEPDSELVATALTNRKNRQGPDGSAP